MLTESQVVPFELRSSFVAQLRRHWRWIALVLIGLVPRLYLLRVFDVELSNDGFDAVNTLKLLQTQGPSAIPRDLVDRFILHPFYMVLLYGWRLLTPASVDFYLAARFLSSLLACLAILILFEFVRRTLNEYAAWVAALLLAFSPTFLWESASILSSTLFLALYLGVLFALTRSRYRLASGLAFLAALTRYEGTVLIALVFIVLLVRDARARHLQWRDWLVLFCFALAVPLVLIGSGWLATRNPLEFIGAQSMAALWLRFLAPGDFSKRAAFFLTQYPALFPLPVVLLGLAGAVLALWRHRSRATALLLLVAVLYLLFFEILVFFDYTTLEVRFLMYPGLPLLIFAGMVLADVRAFLFGASSTRAPSVTLALAGSARVARSDLCGEAISPGANKDSDSAGEIASGQQPALAMTDSASALPSGRWAARVWGEAGLAAVVLVLLVLSYQQGLDGIRFVYNMHASQRQVVDEMVPLIRPNEPTNVMIYAGVSGAFDFYARQRGLDLAFSYFRYAPDDRPEQYLAARRVQFIIYPVGNAFAKAKYPYLARFEDQTHNGITFRPVTQFTTSLDHQLYSIWAVTP